jgi:hypothetical protein
MVNGVRGDSVLCVDDAVQTKFYTLSFHCVEQRPKVTQDMKIEQNETEHQAFHRPVTSCQMTRELPVQPFSSISCGSRLMGHFVYQATAH